MGANLQQITSFLHNHPATVVPLVAETATPRRPTFKTADKDYYTTML